MDIEVLKQIQKQVSKCWSVPSAKANGPIVDILVKLDDEGHVTEARIQDMRRYYLNKEFRSYANRAQHAVVACSPINIPSSSPELYRRFILSFDPKIFVGLAPLCLRGGLTASGASECASFSPPSS